MDEASRLEEFLDNVRVLEVKKDDYIKGLRLLEIGNTQQREKAFKFLSIEEYFKYEPTLEQEALLLETYMDVNDMKQLKKWDYRKGIRLAMIGNNKQKEKGQCYYQNIGG